MTPPEIEPALPGHWRTLSSTSFSASWNSLNSLNTKLSENELLYPFVYRERVYRDKKIMKSN